MTLDYLKLRQSWAEWPDADQSAWELAIARGETALCQRGCFGHLSERSIELYATGATMARRWAIGEGASPAMRHADIWTCERVMAYDDDMSARGYHCNTRRGRLMGIARVSYAVNQLSSTRPVLHLINNVWFDADAGCVSPPPRPVAR